MHIDCIGSFLFSCILYYYIPSYPWALSLLLNKLLIINGKLSSLKFKTTCKDDKGYTTLHN